MEGHAPVRRLTVPTDQTDVELPADAPTTTARRGYDRAEVDEFVDATRRRLRTMADRLGQQQADLERLESENRSYSRSIDIAMKAAGAFSSPTATSSTKRMSPPATLGPTSFRKSPKRWK